MISPRTLPPSRSEGAHAGVGSARRATLGAPGDDFPFAARAPFKPSSVFSSLSMAGPYLRRSPSQHLAEV